MGRKITLHRDRRFTLRAGGMVFARQSEVTEDMRPHLTQPEVDRIGLHISGRSALRGKPAATETDWTPIESRQVAFRCRTSLVAAVDDAAAVAGVSRARWIVECIEREIAGREAG